MTAKTIAARISKLTPEDVNNIIDRINDVDVELSEAAELAWKAIADTPLIYVNDLYQRWETAQDERAQGFQVGDAVEFEVPGNRMHMADSYGMYYRGNGWAPTSELLTITGTVSGHRLPRHRLLVQCADGEWSISPSLVRKAS